MEAKDQNGTSADVDSKIINFHQYVIQQCKEHDYPLSNIGNMDETPMNFGMIENETVDSKSAKTVLIKTTGHEKSSFTVARMANDIRN